MTISSIYVDRPGYTHGTEGVFSAGKDVTFTAETRETLQEVTDRASLSGIAPRLQAALKEIAGPENNVLNSLADNIDRLQEGFIETLYTAFSEENIDVSHKITLRMGMDGALVLASDHPEKERVEKILKDNSALSAAFGEIATQSSVLRDIANINEAMIRQTGAEAYSSGTVKSSFSVYQVSLKGDMNHFYFSKGCHEK